MSKAMITPMTAAEFRSSGGLWFANRILHVFGLVLVFNPKEDTITPARCAFRGFSERDEESGFNALTRHMASELPKLLEDTSADIGKDA